MSNLVTSNTEQWTKRIAYKRYDCVAPLPSTTAHKPQRSVNPVTGQVFERIGGKWMLVLTAPSLDSARATKRKAMPIVSEHGAYVTPTCPEWLTPIDAPEHWLGAKSK